MAARVRRFLPSSFPLFLEVSGDAGGAEGIHREIFFNRRILLTDKREAAPTRRSQVVTESRGAPTSLGGTSRASISPRRHFDLASLRLALHLDEELGTREFSRQFYADSEALPPGASRCSTRD
jgi:hypothetical protein